MRLISFAYAFGTPRGVLPEHIYDLRRYPCASADLCTRYDGRDRRLRRELLHSPQYGHLLDEIRQTYTGDEDVTLYVGCDEGRHRSVAVVMELAQQWPGVEVEHRDLNRRAQQRATTIERNRQRDRRCAVMMEE
jgi:RNase adaptor protein for sRNA GlmZ degradation